VKLLQPGQILFVVLSEAATDEAGRLVSASIGMAIPKDPTCYGYLAEHEGGGPTEKEAGLFAEYLAAEMLATKMGGKLKEPGKGRKAYHISNGISLETRSISQTSLGEQDLWTTALAAAVLIS
jgi:arginine decarboxylase